MLAPSRSTPSGTVFRWLCLSLLSVTVASARESISRPTPPHEPAVPPSISRHFPTDKNSDRIQDSLADRAFQLEAVANNPTRPADRIDARRQLDEYAEVELIFSRQISQRHLDDFLASNGEITHLYEAVSYGWNGRLPLGKIHALAASMGDALVQIEEDRPAVLHLDQATRTGRVRPIWAAGFAGNVSGFDGDTNITISVLDTGVDGTHMDLNGRNVFWEDYTTDNEPSPFDLIQHGTHVAGIALGSGASAGVPTGNLLFTDEGDLTGVSAGSFFPSPFGLSPVSTTVNLVATWQGGGSTTLHLVYHTKGTAGGYAAQASVTGTSPLTINTTFTPLTTRAYSAALTAAASVGAYNVKGQASNFEAIGDGFNKLRGVAPGCNWAGAKVFSNTGSGSSLDINAGIDGLVANRVANNIKVMNISLGIIGTPGISAAQRAKVNTAVNNGILVVCSAGNDGTEATTAAREIDDPGRAALALTVGAANDINQLTDYTSIGFSTLSSTSGQEEDFKPDLMAPGGSASYYTSIMSVDSNSGDGPSFADQRTNDYYNIQGTSMSTPFVAGCAALVIDALQQRGTNWSFSSSQHPRLVKMLLCATTTESNANRDSAANNPTLQRAAAGPSSYPIGKDPHEGYGNANPDAAVEAVALAYNMGNVVGETFGGTANDKRAWARSVQLPAGANFNVSLTVPGTGDFDLHLYSRTPSAFGTPILLASSTVAGLGAAETVNYTPSITTNVILVVKRVSGNGTFSLVGTGPVIANFSATPTNGSAPLAVTFTNLSSSATNYSWAFGDGNVSSTANPTNTYASPGVYSVTLTAIGATGSNTLTRTSYINVTNPPGTAADFSASPLSGVPPLMVTFNNLSASATNYIWDFGDGESSTDTNVVHTYTNTGNYTVTLTAIGDTGTNTFTRTNYIVVTNFLPVTVNFAAAPLSGVAPLLVSFTNLSAHATNHLWNFGDGGFSSAANPSHTFTNSGLFTITLTSTGPGGTNSLTRTDYISVSNAPPAIVTHPTSLIITQGNNAAFTVTATGSALQYQWRKGGVDLPAANSPTLSIINAQPADIGTYSVIVSNSSGSVTSSNATLALVTAADAIIVTGPPYLENFNGMGSGGTTAPHGWFVGTGTGAVAAKTVIVSSGASSTGGNYNYGSTGNSDRALGSLASSTTQRDTEARFINLSGSTITAFNVNYTGEQWRVGGNGAVNNTLVMQFSLNGTSFTTMGGGFDFNTPVDSGSASSLNGNSAANRVTNLGGTFGPAGAIPEGQVFYLRWADVDNASADNAMAVDDLTISFTLSNPPPPAVTANFIANITEGLAPLTVNFTNFSANATNYSWNFGDGNTSALEHPANTFTNAGSFSVTLVAIGLGGTNSLTFTNYIVATNYPPVIANFSAEPTHGLAPLAVTFTNLSSNATDFAWNFGDGNASTNQHPLNTYSNAGSFTVTLTASGLGGTNSVAFTNYITATNLPPMLVVMPTPLNLGTVLTGLWSHASFVVSNAGGLLLNAVTTVATDPFFLLDANTNPVASVAFTVPSLATTNLAVRFQPSTEGAFSNVVVFITDGGLSTNVVTGFGFGTPVIVQLTSSAPEFTFSFATVPGKTYEVQYKDALDAALWQTLQFVPGDGSLKTITNLTTTPAERYYRLSVP